MQEVRKQKEHLQLLNTLDGISDELHSTRKNNDENLLQLKNIAGSLDFISQYLYDISWELKKRNEKTLDKTTNLN
jgi:hypothetical protein